MSLKHGEKAAEIRMSLSSCRYPRNRPIVLEVVFAILVGCHPKDLPNTSDYKAQFAKTLPPYVTLTVFDVTAEENDGSKVNPLVRARFKAEIRQTVDTFSTAQAEGDALFLARVSTAAAKHDLYGHATAIMQAEKWVIQFTNDDNTLDQIGKPPTFFNASRVIVIGSEDEKSYRATLEARRLQSEKEMAVAEAQLRAQRATEDRLKLEQRNSIHQHVENDTNVIEFAAYPNFWSEPITLPAQYKRFDWTTANSSSDVSIKVNDGPPYPPTVDRNNLSAPAGSNLSFMAIGTRPITVTLKIRT